MTNDAVVAWALELERAGEALIAEGHALITLARKLAEGHKHRVRMPDQESAS